MTKGTIASQRSAGVMRQTSRARDLLRQLKRNDVLTYGTQVVFFFAQMLDNVVFKERYEVGAELFQRSFVILGH
jgi:hypothetical protein